MTKKDIEKLFEYGNNGDVENFVNMIPDENLKKQIKGLMETDPESDEFVQLIYDGVHIIINKIKEENLYDEFERIGLTEENKESFLTFIENEKLTREQVEKYIPHVSVHNVADLIIATGDAEYIKQCINDKDMQFNELAKVKLIIATGDKEYIKQQVQNSEYTYERIEMIKATRDQEYIKNCILDKNLNLVESDIIELIKSIDNIEYIKEILNDENLTLSTTSKIELIKSTGDMEFVKELIESEASNLAIYEKLELIKSLGDKEYIKDCIKNSSIELNNKDKIDLIISINDKEYIKECISSKEFGWNSYENLTLIKATKDEEYIKECLSDDSNELYKNHKIDLLYKLKDKEYIKNFIKNKTSDWSMDEKIELVELVEDKEFVISFIKHNSLKLTEHEKCKIIISINDIDFIKECVKDESLALKSSLKTSLIISTGDTDYIKKCIEDKTFNFERDDIRKLIVATKDRQYIKEYLKSGMEQELSERDKYDILRTVGNKDFLRECILDKEIGLEKDTIINLIEDGKDQEFIKSIIKSNEFGFNFSDKNRLVKCITDKEYVKNYIIENTKNMQGIEKVNLILELGGHDAESYIEDERLNLSEFEKSALIVRTKSKEKIKEHFKSSKESKKRIKLPAGMTIGVEIEADDFILKRVLFDGWVSKGDGSIPYGLEIVSPVLTCSDEDTQNIYTACNMLTRLHCEANEKCGGHIHIGADFLTDKQAYKNLLEIWGNTEKILYTISNKPGELTRYSGAVLYAVPISKKIESALENGSINLESEVELGEFVSQLRCAQGSRYSGINFLNIADGSSKKTIEFRLANGTIDPDTWIENINLFGGIIAASEKLYQIEQKDEELRTDEERKYLKKFEELKNSDKDEREKLDLLLELTIDKENREIYVERYNENSKILQNDVKTQDALDEEIAIKPVVLKDKKSKALKSGIEATEDSVTISEIEEQEKNIRDMQMDRQKPDTVIYY